MRTTHQKVTASHLRRDAYLYVRQSTMRQIVENAESTRRQYALRERAVALGWPTERVTVIDTDLGLSGADRDREGFQRLVAEVGMGRAGIVLGLEVSRLARNSADWHRLLEICALLPQDPEVFGTFPSHDRKPHQADRGSEGLVASFGDFGHRKLRFPLPVEAPYGSPTGCKPACIIGGRRPVDENLTPSKLGPFERQAHPCHPFP